MGGFKIVAAGAAPGGKKRSAAPWKKDKPSGKDDRKGGGKPKGFKGNGGKFAGKKDGKFAGKDAAGKTGRDGRKSLSRAEKVTITFDRDDRKSYLTGFHIRRKERQVKAAEEIGRTERKERIASRKKYREEVKAMIEENRPTDGSALVPLAARERDAEEIKVRDTTEQSYNTDAQNVTVTTVSFGFDSGPEEGSETDDEEAFAQAFGGQAAKNSKASRNPLLRPGASIKSLKLAAFRKAENAKAPSKAALFKSKKGKGGKRGQGAQPKQSKKKLMKAGRIKKDGEKNGKKGGGKGGKGPKGGKGGK